MKSPDQNKDETFQLELDALFRRHNEVLYRLAYRVTGNPDDAEDVVQTAFVKVIERQDPTEFRKNPMAYLYRVVTHEAINVVREREQWTFTDDDVNALEIPAPMSAIDPDDDLYFDLLRDALATLKPKYVETLNLHYREGCSCLRIAKIRGKPVGSVMADLFRARAMVKKRIRSQEDHREKEQTKRRTGSGPMLAGPSQT